MNCHDAREYFSGWVDEALAAEERGALASHLAQCPDCRRELDRFRETVGLLQRIRRPRAPVGFVDRVLDAVRPTPWHRRVLERLFLPLPVKLPAEAAALLLVAMLAVYVFQRTPDLQPFARQEAPPQPAYRSEPPPAALPGRVRREEAAPRAPQRGPSKVQPPIQAKAGPTVEDTGVPSPEEAAKSKAPSVPAPTAAPAPSAGVEVKKETGVESTVTPRFGEPAPSRPSPAPTQQGRADSAREEARRAPLSMAKPPPAMRALPSADVLGRLAVKDREAAERALVELLARSKGAQLSRRDEPGATVVDLLVPRASYAEFSQGLARIGSWAPEAEPSELPSQVRVTLRLTE